MKSPNSQEIKKARNAVKLTQQQSANVVFAAVRIWRYYEAGQRKMPPAIWELFMLKTGQTKLIISEFI